MPIVEEPEITDEIALRQIEYFSNGLLKFIF